jgi:hypothetical protein
VRRAPRQDREDRVRPRQLRRRRGACASSGGLLRRRVTRLGENSPLGWLLTLGSVLEITEVVRIFSLLFPR